MTGLKTTFGFFVNWTPGT